MRTPFLFFNLTALLVISMNLVSCQNEDDQSQPTNPLQTTVTSGDWKISSFLDSGKDETQHFSGFAFTFETNGTLKAKRQSESYSGTWEITDSNSFDDSPGTPDLVIFFNLTNDFESLNEDWTIVSQTSSRIELKHVSGGNGGTDFLTFEKN